MLRKLFSTLLAGMLLIVIAIGLAAGYFVWSQHLAPRMLGQLGHSAEPAVVRIEPRLKPWLDRVQTALDHLDRAGMRNTVLPVPMLPSAQAEALPPQPQSATARAVTTTSAGEIVEAIRNARPGDVITIAPGTYHFTRRAISVENPGTEQARITVRAAQAGTVQLEFDMLEGFHVLVPYWTFENLNIRGVCAQHSDCEHAFHVVRQAHDFIARNNTITDFNAHFKINGENGQEPDHGRIEGNTLSNTSVRHTSNPVTPIDLVAASDWQVVGNRISDFIRDGADHVSYGAFFKGAGSNNHFDRNVVLCENLLRGFPGSRVGLSLGGGGSTPVYCRDKECKVEQEDGVVQSNLIAACSDVGVYINRAANSHVVHNTLIDTGGIDVRFPESTAELEGNLVDGVIRSRDGGILKETDNRATSVAELYLGSHPVRDLFKNATQLDLTWNGTPPRRAAASSIPLDLCLTPRSKQPTYGAFEDYARCKVPVGQ